MLPSSRYARLLRTRPGKIISLRLTRAPESCATTCDQRGWIKLAERGGFEPPVEVLAPTTVGKTAAFGYRETRGLKPRVINPPLLSPHIFGECRLPRNDLDSRKEQRVWRMPFVQYASFHRVRLQIGVRDVVLAGKPLIGVPRVHNPT